MTPQSMTKQNRTTNRRSLTSWKDWITTMTFTLEHLEEPHLQFGAYFEHQDSKTGLAEYGPFGQNIEGLHPSEIKLGFIGTRETVAGAKEWIRECGSPIESSNIKTIGTS